MIGMLRGKAWEIQIDHLIIDVGGVGYSLTVPQSLLTKIKPGQEIMLYVHTVLKEDDLSLYGFSSLEEKNLFLAMLSVSGIGPKAAMSIMSAFGAVQVQSAIASENISLLTKVPGIGKKTAQRVILELKDKFKGQIADYGEVVSGHVQTIQSEAMETLLALGFTMEEARQALGYVTKETEVDLSTEDQIKKALRYLGGQK